MMIRWMNHSLRRTLLVQVGLLVVGPVVLAGVAGVALRAVSTEYGAVAAGYREMTRAAEVGARMQTARALLMAGQGEMARRELESAGRRVAAMGGEFGAGADVRLWQKLSRDVNTAVRANSAGAIDEGVRDVANIVDGVQRRIDATEKASAARERWTIVLMIVGALLLAALSVGVGWSQHRTIALPLERVRRAAGDLAGGRMSSRVPSTGPGELRALAGEFNRMASELEALYRELEAKVEVRTRQLVGSAKLASVGYLAAGVAHQINNPLSIITGYAERELRRPGVSGEVERALKVVCEEAYRCKEITGKLLSLVGGAEREVEAVDLGRLVSVVAAQVRELPVMGGRRLEVVGAGQGVVAGGREEDFRQVLLNLVINAIEATSDSGVISVEVRREGHSAVVAVSDDGVGIAAEDLGRVFEPFFTRHSDGDRVGVGLGLALVQSMLEGVGGTVEAQSAGVGKGARFVVRVPVIDAAH